MDVQGLFIEFHGFLVDCHAFFMAFHGVFSITLIRRSWISSLFKHFLSICRSSLAFRRTESLQLFSEMRSRDVVSLGATVMACKGHWQLALLLVRLELLKVGPT